MKIMKKKMTTISTFMLLFLIFTSVSLTTLSSTTAKATQVAPQDSWVSKANLHDARSGLGTAVTNGKIHAIGGASNQGFSATNEEYDFATNTWIVKASMPTPRSSFGIAVCQNKIYCIGGYVPGGATGVNEVYDPATDSWETKASMPTPLENIAANLFEGKIYIIGGNPNQTIIQVYDPATNSWTTKASIPTVFYGYASALVDSKIYFFTTGLTQIYDVLNDSWSRGTPAPSPVVLAAAGATTGVYAPQRIYVFGANAKDPYWQLFTEGFIIQSYDPKTDTWTNGTMPSGRYSVSVAVVDDLLYVVGGFTEAFRTDKFDLNPIITFSSLNQQYTPIGYGAVPPFIDVISPQNRNYTSSGVSVNFTVNRAADWMGYSLDGKENVTVTGNATINGLTVGLHNITFYTKDTSGNIGASETIAFSIASEPFLTPTVAAVSGAAAVVVLVAGLLVYFKKRSQVKLDGYE